MFDYIVDEFGRLNVLNKHIRMSLCEINKNI